MKNSVMVIAEKPSVAMSITKILGANNKKDGYYEGNGYIVSWCYGHLAGLADPDEYGEKYAEKPWKVENLPIIPKEWKFCVNADAKKQFNILKTLMNSAEVTEIVCATDAGREGECIFRYVYTMANCRKPFKRLWISSLEDSAIREGFKNLRDGSDFDNLYSAGLCRAKADWLIGMNGTRLLSAVYRSFLSVGRVQTPTLAMITERDGKIKDFVKETYYTVKLGCGSFSALSERIDGDNAAQQVNAACNGQKAVVTLVKWEKKTVNPPKLYDLTTLQREANRLFSFSAQQTLNFLQSLYEKRLSTYPRVDSQYLTEDMAGTAANVIGLILGNIPCYSGFSYSPNVERVLNSSKVNDHTAIILTAEIGKASLGGLSEGERKILELIANKMLCATADRHEYETVTATIECCGFSFTAKGKTVIKDGWKEIDGIFKGRTEDSDGETPLNLTEGQEIDGVSSDVLLNYTSPPKPYTEDTLLSAMETAGNKDYVPDSDTEKKGIGTPATRAATIETLIKRGYVERQKKNIVATEKGNNLIKIVPNNIKSAKLTAEWETVLQQIEKGEADADSFMASITALTKVLFVANSVAEKEFINAFPTSGANAIGKCPKCSGDVVENSKAFSCNNRCGFVIWKNKNSKTITAAQAKKLLEKGKTDKITGFKSKAGKPFDASLIIKEDFSVGFEF